MYQTQIQKWGNSQGIRIPKIILDQVSIRDNTRIEIIVKDESIILKKISPKTFKELVSGYENSGYRYEEFDTGLPVGREEFWGRIYQNKAI